MAIMRNKRTTIIGAIARVLNESSMPLPVNDIYDRIVADDYYSFKAQDPLSVVRVELRRHCQGVDFPTASKKKYFQILNDGTYCLIEQAHLFLKEDRKKKILDNDEKRLAATLRATYDDYIKSFKMQLLKQIKDIDPEPFEHFCKNLLKAYGFKDLKVTKRSKDGGIDGYGKLKVGIASLSVAFQCKNWKDTTVGRTEIDKFRGAIQGDFEQGILFTTSKFSKEAFSTTTKRALSL